MDVMPLTPKQVIDELDKTRRPVTARALTDWRSPQRQMLPELTEVGRGRGKGKSYVWTEPDIIDRVAFIADCAGGGTPRINLALWCCGFDVPTEALRAAWLDAIAHALRGWSKQEKSTIPTAPNDTYFENLSDVFHRLANYTVEAAAKGENKLTESAYPLAQLMLQSFSALRSPKALLAKCLE